MDQGHRDKVVDEIEVVFYLFILSLELDYSTVVKMPLNVMSWL